MVGICTSSYPIEKVEDFPYPYPYSVNVGILHQNDDELRQYSRKQVYLSSKFIQFTLSTLVQVQLSRLGQGQTK